MSVKDWRPGLPGGRMRGDIEIRILGNLGDRNAMDYGGHIVHEVQQPDRSRTIESEFWFEPVGEGDTYTVYRWLGEKDAMKDLDWVRDRWEDVARSSGYTLENLRALAVSDNPVERAMVYELVGHYFGFDNLDSYPETFTRTEMEARWPEYA